MTEKKDKELRSGYTTGACAAAAAAGAARMLCEQQLVDSVEIDLPAGVTARFTVQGQSFTAESAACFVIKDAGDDPDVTDGVEVHATVALSPPSPRPSPSGGEGEGPVSKKNLPPPLKGGGPGEGDASILILGGVGVGKVTKPGLAVAIGEPAINPVPRQMIESAVRALFPEEGIEVTISIPDGLARSKRTLNERLGIIGGLSILGTTGIVRPISHQAWTDTIDVAIDVALASVCQEVVLVTGRTSEQVAQAELKLAEESFIMMGDHVGYALEACHRKGVPRIIVAAQFAKLLKMACGHAQTHVHSSELDLSQLAEWSRDAGLDGSTVEKIECANTAREVVTTLPQSGSIGQLVAGRAADHLMKWSGGVPVEIMLIDYNGTVAGCYRSDNKKDLSK